MPKLLQLKSGTCPFGIHAVTAAAGQAPNLRCNSQTHCPQLGSESPAEIELTVFVDCVCAGTARFTAQQLRTIFVAERRSATAVEGPGEVGAALAMGNSPGMWDRVYDRSFRRRELQAAVDAMQLWREGAIGAVDVEALANVMPVSLEEEIEICLLSDSDSDIEVL